MQSPQSLLERAAEYALAVRLEDVPARAAATARRQLASALAACHAGALNSRASAAFDLAGVGGASPSGALLPSGARAPLSLAVLANVLAAESSGLGDFLFLAESAHTPVLAGLAAGEARGRTLRDLLAAQVAANELVGRLGAALACGPRRTRAPYVLHAAGAAVAAGRMLGLGRDQLAHALALALALPPQSQGRPPPDARVLGAALSASHGAVSALLAQRGFEGDLDALEASASPPGLPLRRVIESFSSLGQVFLTETWSVKLHPCAPAIAPAVEALLDCLAERRKTRGYPLLASEVEACEVLVTAPLWPAPEPADPSAGPLRSGAVGECARLALAVALLNGRLRTEDLADGSLARIEQQVRTFARRISVVPEGPAGQRRAAAEFYRALGLAGSASHLLARLSALPPARPHLLQTDGHLPKLAFQESGHLALPSLVFSRADLSRLRWPFRARVRLRLRGGEALEASREAAPGGPSDSQQESLVAAKLEREAGRMLGHAHAASLVRLVLHGHEQTSLRELVAAATAPAHGRAAS